MVVRVCVFVCVCVTLAIFTLRLVCVCAPGRVLNVTVTDRSNLVTIAFINVTLIVQADPPVVYPANFTVQESVPSVPAG